MVEECPPRHQHGGTPGLGPALCPSYKKGKKSLNTGTTLIQKSQRPAQFLYSKTYPPNLATNSCVATGVFKLGNHQTAG